MIRTYVDKTFFNFDDISSFVKPLEVTFVKLLVKNPGDFLVITSWLMLSKCIYSSKIDFEPLFLNLLLTNLEDPVKELKENLEENNLCIMRKVKL